MHGNEPLNNKPRAVRHRWPRLLCDLRVPPSRRAVRSRARLTTWLLLHTPSSLAQTAALRQICVASRRVTAAAVAVPVPASAAERAQAHRGNPAMSCHALTPPA
jgi:hypothetical protein